MIALPMSDLSHHPNSSTFLLFLVSSRVVDLSENTTARLTSMRGLDFVYLDNRCSSALNLLCPRELQLICCLFKPTYLRSLQVSLALVSQNQADEDESHWSSWTDPLETP